MGTILVSWGRRSITPRLILSRKNKKSTRKMVNRTLTPETPIRQGNLITFMGKLIAVILPASKMYDKGSKSSQDRLSPMG
jgi:hypothetical protein